MKTSRTLACLVALAAVLCAGDYASAEPNDDGGAPQARIHVFPACTVQRRRQVRVPAETKCCKTPIYETVDLPVYDEVCVPGAKVEYVPVYETRKVPTYKTVMVPLMRKFAVPIYSTRQVPVFTTCKVPEYEEVDVPVYRTEKVPVYETRRVPEYITLTLPNYVMKPVPKYGTKLVPDVQDIEIPVYKTIPAPIYTTKQVPVYEEVEVPVTKVVCDPCTGDRETVECGTRTERRCIGTREEQVQCGTRPCRVQCGTRTVKRCVGMKEVPEVCCWETMKQRQGTRKERRIAGYKEKKVQVGCETKRTQIGTRKQRRLKRVVTKRVISGWRTERYISGREIRSVRQGTKPQVVFDKFCEEKVQVGVKKCTSPGRQTMCKQVGTRKVRQFRGYDTKTVVVCPERWETECCEVELPCLSLTVVPDGAERIAPFSGTSRTVTESELAEIQASRN